MIAVAGALARGAPALAQQGVGPIGAEQRDIGRLETRIQRYDQALGVIAKLARPLGAEIECNGICYTPNGTRATSWRCAPTARCDLHCDVNPPVGGCD
ncbi:MAG TPA: hypothetical protein VGM07_00265 [Stellaceae bacterium]